MTSLHRLESIQALRGVAALVVVLFHASVLSIDYLAGAIYSPWTLVGKAGVDLFFVISGFVMVYTTYRRFDEPGAATRFAISRISRIYPPYWILAAMVFLYWLHNPGGVNSKSGQVNLLTSFLLLPGGGLPLVPVAWTLVCEVFFYFVFWLVMVFGSARLLLPCISLWGLCVLTNTAVGLVNANAMVRGLPLSPFNLEFIVGVLLALMGIRRGGRSALIVSLMAFAAMAVGFQLTGQEESIPVANRVLLFLAPCAGLVYGLVALETSGWRPSRFLVWIGDWSYSLYLVHILVMHLVYRVATRRTSIEWTGASAWMLAGAVVLLSVVIGYLYYRVVEQKATRYVRNALTLALATVQRGRA